MGKRPNRGGGGGVGVEGGLAKDYTFCCIFWHPSLIKFWRNFSVHYPNMTFQNMSSRASPVECSSRERTVQGAPWEEHFMKVEVALKCLINLFVARFIWPAGGTWTNLLSLLALLANEMAIGTLEYSTRWWHHLSLKLIYTFISFIFKKLKKQGIWAEFPVYYLIANGALKIFFKNCIPGDGWRGRSSHSIETVKRVQLTFCHLGFHHNHSIAVLVL